MVSHGSLDRQRDDHLGWIYRGSEPFARRRQILRAIHAANADTYCDTNCHGNSHADTYRDTNCHSNSHADTYANGYSHTVTDTNS